MPYDHFYHYTGHDSLRAIFENAGLQGGYGTGLVPHRRFIPFGQAVGLPDKAHDGAVFGLLSPRPDEWLDRKNWWGNSNVFHQILIRMGGFPRILLKARITKRDDIYVADWGVHLREDFDGTAMEDKTVVHEVKKAYWESLVPLSDYSEKLKYRIPEVICFSAIPPRRLEIVDKIARSELQRYIDTGIHDPAAVERDRIEEEKQDRRFLKSLDLKF